MGGRSRPGDDGRTGAAHDRIDRFLQEWCRARSADDVVELLWDAGVPVGKVALPHRQPELAQLAFRDFFEEVDHPVIGRSRYSTLPMRFSRTRDGSTSGTHRSSVSTTRNSSVGSD